MLAGPVLWLGLLACGPPTAPTAASDKPSLGWISELAGQPASFSALMEQTGRDGWVQLHAHDDARATATFGADPVLRSRPAWKVATLNADLADLSETAHRRLFEGWATRGPLPPGGAAIAAWSAWCGEGGADPWLDRVGPTDPGSDLVDLLRTHPDSWASPGSPATERLIAHHAALTDDPRAPWDRPELPVLEVSGEIPRTWYDPCFHRVAAGHAERVATDGQGFPALAEQWLAQPGLAATLFAPWLTAEDLRADLQAGVRPAEWGARSAATAGLVGAIGLPGTTDDAQLAREHARVLAETLGQRLKALEASADDNGQALLIELRLGEQWRQQWHVAQARMALDADRPRQALAYADLGIDFASPAGVANPPALFALRAHALLHLGRSREALDALHSLDAFRGVRQVSEVLGDLAVLEGLDRAGDSKEN